MFVPGMLRTATTYVKVERTLRNARTVIIADSDAGFQGALVYKQK